MDKQEQTTDWRTIKACMEATNTDQTAAYRWAKKLIGTDKRRQANGITEVDFRAWCEVGRVKIPDNQATSAGQADDNQSDNQVTGEVEFLRAQLVERDAQFRALLRIVDEDREELRRLRAQASLPEGQSQSNQDDRSEAQEETPEPVPVERRRGLVARIVDVILLRGN